MAIIKCDDLATKGSPHVEKSVSDEENLMARDRWREARKILGVKKGYVMHHVLPCLRQHNLKRYMEWNPEDLVVLTRSEHIKIHNDLLKAMPEAYDEIRLKLSANSKGRYVGGKSARARKVVCVETGKVYGALSEAAREMGGNWQCIQAVCKGINKSAYGYTWEYYKGGDENAG